MSFLRLTAIGWLTWTLVAAVQAAEPAIAPDDLAFFEKRIRPVLVANCYGCHSAQAPQIKGGLVLDTREGVLRGGETGPVLVSKNPAESLLIQAIKYADDAPAMPPKKKLPDEVIDDFERWVKMGAPDPRDGKAAVAKQGIDIEKGRKFWAFVPPQAGKLPAVKDASWPISDADRFLLAAMESKGLRPVADADAHSFIRRLYFDLIGLPPSAEEAEKLSRGVAPLLQTSAVPEEREAAAHALEKIVDDLLASPRFGERWGRHWLDVARFAETSGRQVNFNYPQAWRYRDWVIAAINADKPFDVFVREQIAGDLMPTADPHERAKRQVATGFLAVGPKPHSERNPLQFQMDLADEQIDAMSQAFLGLTVACARCHDHKFDPIPQRDYYALVGIFRSTETCYGTVRIIQSLNPSPLVELPEGSNEPSAMPTLSTKEFADLKQQLATVQERFDSAQKAGKSTTGTDFNLIGTLTSRIAFHDAEGKPKLLAMGAREGSAMMNSPLYQRGEVDQPGEVVPRGLVQVVTNSLPTIPPASSGRLELAEWLASRDNPLTARVFVNRVWVHLFGRGLVPSPDNFGAAGMAPDHPELLDHLAVSFMNDGWSVKRLIRSIVLGRAYRLSSRHDEKNVEADPDNVLVWRMSPRRLEAEAIRDALLDFGGRLEKTPPIGNAIAVGGENGSNGILRRLASLDTSDLHRAVYLPVIRDGVLESLGLFDFADPSLVVAQRAATTVPIQGLYLFNNTFVLSQMDSIADRLIADAKDEDTRLTLAYTRILGRPPTAAERESCLAFLKKYAAQLAEEKVQPAKRPTNVWSALCQALIGSADFLYLR